jgi:hypothetical protein
MVPGTSEKEREEYVFEVTAGGAGTFGEAY